MFSFKPALQGKTLFFLLILITYSASPSHAHKQYHGDGTLRLYNYHLNESLEVRFRDQGKIVPQGLKKIQYLFRSRDNSEAISVPTRLIDLLDHIQDHFQADTIEIISGYRRKAFNEQLKSEGHAVSTVSYHMKGMAADIHIDEITEETLRDYAQSIQQGGVGYYGPMDFVHLDIGPYRTWGDQGAFRRKLIGVLQKKQLPQLISKKNDHRLADTLEFKWSWPHKKKPPAISNMQLEHFFRGQWHPIAPLTAKYQKNFSIQCQDKLFQKAGKPRYGKYRITFTINDKKSFSSIEIYLKRI